MDHPSQRRLVLAVIKPKRQPTKRRKSPQAKIHMLERISWQLYFFVIFFSAAIFVPTLAFSIKNNNSNKTPTTTTTIMSSSTTTIKRIDLIKPGGFVAGENLVTNDDIPIPTPSSTEVLIDVKASSINPVDWKQAEYNFMVPPDVSPSNPAALGCDIAGVVIGPENSPLLGKNVVTYLGADKSKSGVTRGGFTDLVVADSDLVFEIPSTTGSMTLADATTLPVPGLTAGLLLDAIQPSQSEWIVIWGTSSAVGYFALQLAKTKQEYGPHKVIAIASSKHKDTAMALGADAFIDYRTESDIVGAVTKIVKDAGGSLTASVDCIGSPDTFRTCCEIVHALAGNDSDKKKVVSCTNFGDDGPNGVKRHPVNLGTANDDNREFVTSYFPNLLNLKPQPIKLVKGPIDAKTVQDAFQLNKDGVSGEKVVIEWTK